MDSMGLGGLVSKLITYALSAVALLLLISGVYYIFTNPGSIKRGEDARKRLESQ